MCLLMSKVPYKLGESAIRKATHIFKYVNTFVFIICFWFFPRRAYTTNFSRAWMELNSFDKLCPDKSKSINIYLP